MGLRAVHRVFLIACAGVVLAAMVAVMPATATAGGLQLTVRPTVSAADTPLSIRVSGVQPGANVPYGHLGRRRRHQVDLDLYLHGQLSWHCEHGDLARQVGLPRDRPNGPR